jgi:hypothetical protein
MESGLGSGRTGYFMDAYRLDEEFPQLDLAVPAGLPAVPTGLGCGLSLR